MFILKRGHQPGVYVPLRALFLVCFFYCFFFFFGGGGGGYFVTWLSRPILSLKFLDPCWAAFL